MPLFSATAPLTLPELAAALRSRDALRLSPEAEARLLASPPGAAVPGASLLLGHACGTGPEVPAELVRRLLLLQVQHLSRRAGRAQLATAKRLLDFYSREVWPVVPEQGALEAPLAHLSLPLLGLGDVNYQGYRLAASDVLGLFGWEPVALGEPEARALLGGPQFGLAYATEALERTRHLLAAAAVLGTLTATALAPPAPPAEASHAVAGVTQILEKACNSEDDASFLLPGSTAADVPYHSLAQALYELAQLTATLGRTSAERTRQLLLAHSALLGPQRTAASLALENEQLGAPAPAAGALSTYAATRARRMVENAEQILGIELLAARVIGLRQLAGPGGASHPALAAAVAAFGEAVTFVGPGRVLAPDLHRAARFVREYQWA